MKFVVYQEQFWVKLTGTGAFPGRRTWVSVGVWVAGFLDSLGWATSS